MIALTQTPHRPQDCAPAALYRSARQIQSLKEKTMKANTQKIERLPALMGAVGMMLLGAGYTMSAHASCAMAALQQGESWNKPFALLGAKTDRAAVAALVAQDPEDWGGGPESIVGVWKFQFISEGNTALDIPDGVQLDAGHVTWHSDHSELMNSGRAPIVGDFCMGMWQKVGHSTYKLNHFASNWTIDKSVPVFGEMTTGPTIIHETVTVARGDNSYVGEFTITNYQPDAKTVLGPVITGVVYGRRETLTSTD
jgi:hypothetical protein